LPVSREGIEILYTWVFSAGVILSALWLAFQPPRRLASARTQSFDLLPAFTSALAGGLLCARLGYVLTYFNYFKLNPIESLWLWQGGLSGTGGFLGALVGIGAYAGWTHLPFNKISDALSLPTLLITVCSWIGCWLEGCVYGLALTAEAPLLMTRDMFGELASRWPAALIGLTPPLAALLLLTQAGVQHRKSGCQAALAGSAVALGILLASFVRADPLPILLQLRLDTLAGLVLTIAGLSALLICYRRAR
jgi:phosphatidylglycerol:prolipoprotein diacylglycerol transferase